MNDLLRHVEGYAGYPDWQQVYRISEKDSGDGRKMKWTGEESLMTNTNIDPADIRVKTTESIKEN